MATLQEIMAAAAGARPAEQESILARIVGAFSPQNVGPSLGLTPEQVAQAQLEQRPAQRPAQPDNVITDAQGNFLGSLTQQSLPENQPAGPPAFADDQLSGTPGLPAGAADQLATAAGQGAALPSAAAPEVELARGLSLAQILEQPSPTPEKEAERSTASKPSRTLQSLSQALKTDPASVPEHVKDPQSAQDAKALEPVVKEVEKKQGPGAVGFLFNLLGAAASDPRIASDSIGRLLEQTGAVGDFKSSRERKREDDLALAQFRRGMDLLIEGSRSADRKAVLKQRKAELEARNEDRKARREQREKEFNIGTKLKEQEAQIKREKLKADIKAAEAALKKSQSAEARAQSQQQLRELKAQEKANSLRESLLSAKSGLFGGNTSTLAKSIEKNLKIPADAVKDDLDAIAEITDPAQREQAIEQVVQRLTPTQATAQPARRRPTREEALAELERRRRLQQGQ